MSVQVQRTAIEKQATKDFFIRKIQNCMIALDYSDDQKDAKAKSERLEALQEMQDLLSDSKSVSLYFLPNIELIFEMFQQNLFRPLNSFKKSSQKLEISETGKEDDESTSDPAWPYLQGIYELFLKVIVNETVDVKTLKVLVTPGFIHNLLEIFNTEESREKKYLKTVLHRLYAKLIPRRKMIRKTIISLFSFNLFDIIVLCT